jgi:hypothetical protein
MATRNPANEIEFGAVNFGATISVFAVAGATGADAQVAPGQDMEAFVEAAQAKGTMIGLGAEASGAFNLYMEGSSWTASDLEAAVQATGGVFASATVTDAGL